MFCKLSDAFCVSTTTTRYLEFIEKRPGPTNPEAMQRGALDWMSIPYDYVHDEVDYLLMRTLDQAPVQNLLLFSPSFFIFSFFLFKAVLAWSDQQDRNAILLPWQVGYLVHTHYPQSYFPSLAKRTKPTVRTLGAFASSRRGCGLDVRRSVQNQASHHGQGHAPHAV